MLKIYSLCLLNTCKLSTYVHNIFPLVDKVCTFTMYTLYFIIISCYVKVNQL